MQYNIENTIMITIRLVNQVLVSDNPLRVDKLLNK